MEMCECLAAWVDTEPCICNELPGVPAPLDAKKLEEATNLTRKIASMDRALGKLKPEAYHEMVVHFGQHEDPLRLYVPDDMIAGIVRTLRRHRLIELAKTGVTSGANGHRPVLK